MRDLSDKLAKLRDPLPKPGDIIDGITIHEQVGQGGMMVVFRATYREMTVAFKILLPRHAGSTVAHEMMELERDVLGAVNHHAIPRFIMAGTHNSLPYTVQTFIHGLSLGNFFTGLGSDFVEDIISLCHALDVLHLAGIIHRDIKPDNILMDPTNHHLTLIDFSSCQFLKRGEGKKTGVGWAVGTVDLMPPEVAMGLETSPASDLYAVCGMVRMAGYGSLPIGKPGYKEEYMLSLIHKGEQNPLPEAGLDEARGIPVGIRTIVEQGTDLDPKRRFQTASDLIAALRQISF